MKDQQIQKKNRFGIPLYVLISLISLISFNVPEIFKKIIFDNKNDINLNMKDKFLEKIILDCSNEFGLNSKYMVAHFESENREFNRKAEGQDGEMGLGQILPPTAIQEAKDRNLMDLAKQIKEDKTVLYDTYTNIFLSCSHYRTILDMTNVLDIIDGMGQYNMGKSHWRMKNNYPERIKENYKRRYGNIDINIIFKEMKNK